MGKFDEAIAQHKHAIKLDPTLGDPHRFMANCLIKKGKSREAISEYRRAIALAPADRTGPTGARVHLQLGVCQHQIGNFAEAISEYRIAVSLDPSDSGTLRNIGVAYMQQGVRPSMGTACVVSPCSSLNLPPCRR